jgi:hypothetical protein
MGRVALLQSPTSGVPNLTTAKRSPRWTVGSMLSEGAR